MQENHAPFNIADRYAVALSAILSDSGSLRIEDVMLDYSKSAINDLRRLVDYVFPYCFLNSQIPFEYRITIDPTDLSMAVCVIKEADNKFNINVPVGAFLAVDTASLLITSFLFPESKRIYDYSEESKNVEPLMLDYRFLLDTSLRKHPAENLIYAYPVLFDGKDETEYFTIQSNFALIWMIFHELGHVQLGHFDFLGPGNAVAKMSEDDVRRYPSLSQFLAAEFCADVYANMKFYSTFYRKDAFDMFPSVSRDKMAGLQFLMTASSIPCLLMHRMQLSFAGGGTNSDQRHPDPRTRLFNLFGCITPAIDNNAKFLRQLLNDLGREDVTIDLSIEELGFLTSNVMLLIDEFLKTLHAVPLLPWNVKAEAERLPRGRTLRRARYEKVSKKALLDARAEITSAMLCSCLGAAEFSESTRFSTTHEIWLDTVKLSYALWPPQDQTANQGPKIFDAGIQQTQSFIHEVVHSQRARETNLARYRDTKGIVTQLILAIDPFFADVRGK